MIVLLLLSSSIIAAVGSKNATTWAFFGVLPSECMQKLYSGTLSRVCCILSIVVPSGTVTFLEPKIAQEHDARVIPET